METTTLNGSQVRYSSQMNGLYPIIRRVRRPLVPLVEGAPAEGVRGGADAEPVEEKATPKPPETVVAAVAETAGKEKQSYGSTGREKARK